MSRAAIVTPVDVDGGPIAWREAGSGPLVVFLHGLGTTRTGWEPQLRALAESYRCVAWDMPGYGASPPLSEPLTFTSLSDAVRDLVRHLGETAAHLVGLSFGGMVAQHTALRHPQHVRSLVLVDSSPAFGLDGTDPAEWMRLRLEPLDRGATPAEIAEAVIRSVVGPEAPDKAVAEAVASMARIPSQGLRAAVSCLPTHDLRSELRRILAPTLVLVGEHDRETPRAYSELLAARIPTASLEVVPGAGHLANLEAPEVVNRLIRRFLDALERGGT